MANFVDWKRRGAGMATFSPSDVAFTGFRLVRERPKVVATWALTQFVVSMAFGLVLVATMGPALMRLQAMARETPHDPAVTLGLLSQLAPGYALLMLLSLVMYAIIYAAMNRAVLRPEPVGFAYLRLGNDEFLQFILMVVFFALGIALYLVVLIASIAVIAVVVAIAMSGSKAAVPALSVILFLGLFAGAIYLAIRISLASAMTFDTGRVSVRSAWRLTRGQFWPMFGAYLLTFALVSVVSLLMLVIIGAGIFATGGFAALMQLMRPDLSSVGAFLSPARIVGGALSAVWTALILPVWLTVPAAIYRSLTAPPATMA